MAPLRLCRDRNHFGPMYSQGRQGYSRLIQKSDQTEENALKGSVRTPLAEERGLFVGFLTRRMTTDSHDCLRTEDTQWQFNQSLKTRCLAKVLEVHCQIEDLDIPYFLKAALVVTQVVIFSRLGNKEGIRWGQHFS